jgi:hypothetical protein
MKKKSELRQLWEDLLRRSEEPTPTGSYTHTFMHKPAGQVKVKYPATSGDKHWFESRFETKPLFTDENGDKHIEIISAKPKAERVDTPYIMQGGVFHFGAAV